MWHSTLNPGLYEPERAESALRLMHAAGYNTVRIVVDCCREGNNAGDPKGGVSRAYLENVIDFLKRAEANQINDKAHGLALGVGEPRERRAAAGGGGYGSAR
jgi:hypothetical protein